MGDAEPYGEPITLAQKTKNRLVSNAAPRPKSGPHQSSTSLLPVRAWQRTRQLSQLALRRPQVL